MPVMLKFLIILNNYANVRTINQSKSLRSFSGRDLTGHPTRLLIQTSLPRVCDPKGRLKFRLVNTEAQRFLI